MLIAHFIYEYLVRGAIGPSCKWEANNNTEIISSIHCFPMCFSLNSFPEARPHSLERVRRPGAAAGRDETAVRPSAVGAGGAERRKPSGAGDAA